MSASRPLRTTADLGAFVRNERTNQGLTQSELAKKARVSREWLLRMEAGAVRAETARALRVVAALGYGLTPVPLPARNPENAVNLSDFAKRHREVQP